MKYTRAVHPALLQHIDKWTDCTRCPLRECRHNVVYYGGFLPAPVLFIAKAPDQEADHYGTPYPRKQDSFHQLATAAGRHCVTYLVSCGPIPDKLTKQMAEPCWQKVIDLAIMAQPKLVVCLGKDPFTFVIAGIKPLVDALKYRPAIITVADPFWINTQSDPLQHSQNASLQIEAAVRKYVRND